MRDPLEGRRTVETVLGPLKVVPECRAQAVCVNGSKCWEAGRCLRSPQDEDHECRQCGVNVKVGEFCPQRECPFPRTSAGQVDDDRSSPERDTEKLVEALREIAKYDSATAAGQDLVQYLVGIAREALAEFSVPPAGAPEACPGGLHEWETSGDPATRCVRCGIPWAVSPVPGDEKEQT